MCVCVVKMRGSENILPGKPGLVRLKKQNPSLAMVADYSPRSRLVPFSLLQGASCLLPEARRLSVETDKAVPQGDVVSPVESPFLDAAGLTPAERRVCELMLQGLANKEIASVLNRSQATIKNQVASVLRKCGVPSRMRLMALCR